MLIRQFKKAKNEEYETDGWRMVGAPSTYFPIGGMGVAHDLLEHRQGDEGTVKDELLAFGAALFIRGEGGYWTNSFSRVPPGEHIGGEIGNDLAIKYEGVTQGIPDPGRTKTLESHVEEWIVQGLREARGAINQYLEQFDRDQVEYPFTSEQIELFLTRCAGWLRRGYRSAQKRYRGINPCELSYLFSEIEKAADRLLRDKMAIWNPLVVRLDIRRLRVNVYVEEFNDTDFD